MYPGMPMVRLMNNCLVSLGLQDNSLLHRYNISSRFPQGSEQGKKLKENIHKDCSFNF